MAPLDEYQPLPTQILLLALPTILAVPPTHPLHVQFLKTSLLALRLCLSLKTLAPDEECQACIALADIGMRIAGSALYRSTDESWKWASGIENEVSAYIVQRRHE